MPRSNAYTWLVVSRAVAAVLGGFVVTYWIGPAVVKVAVTWDLLPSMDAAMFSGFVQIVVYILVIIGVCASPSMKKAWVVLALVTAVLIGVTLFTPGPPPPTGMNRTR